MQHLKLHLTLDLKYLTTVISIKTKEWNRLSELEIFSPTEYIEMIYPFLRMAGLNPWL